MASVIDQYTSGASWQDIAKFGITKLVDSEIGNPTTPAPQNTNTKADTQVQTVATGRGTSTKQAGTISTFQGMSTAGKAMVGIGVAFAAFVVYKWVK